MALEQAFKKPRAKIKIGTAFATDLLEFIIPAFDFAMDDCPDDLRPQWKSQRGKYVLPHNGSEIKLVGLDRKPNGLRGTVIDLIILSEAAFISNLHYLFKSVIIPATTHRPNCRVLMLTTPPEVPGHEFLDYMQKAELEGGYIKLTIYDNPLVDETTIARLMKESGGAASTTWRREYLCEHVTDANLQIIMDWDDERFAQITARDQLYGFYHKHAMMDLGVRDHTAALFGYYDFRRAKLIIEDEFVMNGPEMTTNILQAHLKRKEMEIWSGVSEFDDYGDETALRLTEDQIKRVNTAWETHEPAVYQRICDNNNPLLIQDLSLMHQLHYVATDKGTLQEMVNAVKNMVRSEGIIVHPKCKQLRGSLKYGVWDKHRKEFAESKLFGHFDALAALVYGVRNIGSSQVTNPIPPGFGVDPMNQVFFPHQQQGDTVQKFKKAFGLKG